MATKEDTQTKFAEQDYQIRTRAGYNNHCLLVQNDESLASTYGIKRKSALNQSRYFHVVDGLVLDVMHDQLEGVLPLEFKIILKKYIVQEGYFTLDILNDRIARLCYPLSDSSNKPSPIKQQVLARDSGKISQSAAQMWCLARTLPLLLGDLIPHDDCHWENFLRLLKMQEILFAPKTTAQLAAYLGVLVADYLEDFVAINDRHLIPKQHYMVHYPSQITRKGTLVRNWAMRLEAKHNYFKKLATKVNNFNNITYSLSRRHQALQAYLLQSPPGQYLRISQELGPIIGKRTSVSEAGIELEIREVEPCITGDSTLTRSTWVEIYGTKYTRGSVIVIGLHHGLPILGEIKTVLHINDIILWFQYVKLNVFEYVEHLNAYKIEKLNEEGYVKQSRLLDHYPLGIIKGFGVYSTQMFVILKYRIDMM